MPFCNKCKKTLNIDSFYIRKTGKKIGKPLSYCKECLSTQQKEYRKTTKGRVAYRRKHLKNTYDLTVEQFNQMYTNQNGCCVVCETPSGTKYLCVDHDHKTGKIRGLLCTFCNNLAGYIEKHPERIEQIKSYLRKN